MKRAVVTDCRSFPAITRWAAQCKRHSINCHGEMAGNTLSVTQSGGFDDAARLSFLG